MMPAFDMTFRATYWDKCENPFELGEGAVTELLSTQAKALGPVVKTAHELDFLGNTKPNNRNLALSQLIKLSAVILNHL